LCAILKCYVLLLSMAFPATRSAIHVNPWLPKHPFYEQSVLAVWRAPWIQTLSTCRNKNDFRTIDSVRYPLAPWIVSFTKNLKMIKMMWNFGWTLLTLLFFIENKKKLSFWMILTKIHFFKVWSIVFSLVQIILQTHISTKPNGQKSLNFFEVVVLSMEYNIL